MITSLNQNVVKVETSATMTFLERETLSKLHRAFYNNTDEFYEKYLSTTEGTFGKHFIILVINIKLNHTIVINNI